MCVASLTQRLSGLAEKWSLVHMQRVLVRVQAWCKKKKLQPSVTSLEQIPDVGRFFTACYEGKSVSVRWGTGWLCLCVYASVSLQCRGHE
jgi:hypothetical protein